MATPRATIDSFFKRAVPASTYQRNDSSQKIYEQSQSEDESTETETESDSVPRKKFYKRSFKSSWLDKFIWLTFDGDKMYCKYCLEIKKKNSYTVGCRNFRISDINKHTRSRDHSAAAEAYLLKASGATVTSALSRVVSLNEEAVIAAMKNIYWLAKEDIASLKYNSLNELTKLQKCESITHLYVGENAKYTSPEVVKDMQLSISHCIKDDIQKELLQSPVYGILTDEGTDISTTSSLILYTYYVFNGFRKLRFLANVELSHCDASSLYAAILNVLKDYGVSSSKCLGFGSDGASVMTGKENGVAALLKRVNPYLISIHCVAHRLALASSQAASEVSTIVKYRQTLSALYGHFSHSSVKSHELREIQQVLDDPEIKLKKLYDV